MKSSCAAATFFALLITSTPIRAGSPPQVQMAFTAFIAAFNNLDWQTFHNAFADDVTVFNPDIPEVPSVDRIDGRERVEAAFRSVFDASRKQGSGPPYLHIVPRNLQVQSFGDTAVVSFEFDREGHSVGRRTLVFHLQQGAWKIVHIHASNVTQRD